MTEQDKVEVCRQDLIEVLNAMPSWVPMGWPGDGGWSPTALSAKERILKEINDQP